ncbi:trypsin-like peptidase domain-containing protein, partial [Acinetobacter baumannii]
MTFADGHSAAGRLVAADSDGDVAVLAVDTATITPLTWDTDAASALRAGTPVFAVATPPGRDPRVTFGLVSGVGRAFSG